MKLKPLSLTLSLLMTTSVLAGPIFDGSTADMTQDELKNAGKKGEISVTKEKSDTGATNVVISDGKEKAEFLDLQEYFNLKVEKDKNGKVKNFSIDQDKIQELFKTSAPLKVGTMMAFERNGKLAFVSENQRFYFIGELYDMYNGMRKIKTPDDIKKFANRLNYKTLGIDFNTLNSTSVGKGENQVVIWVSPDSPYTKNIMDQAINIVKKDAEKYTFFFVVIPSAGEESFTQTRRFYCARQEGNNEIGNMLYRGTLSELPNATCDMKGFEKTLAVKYMSDVDLVPFVVAHDGRVSRGLPAQGLELFLEQANQEIGSIDNTDKEQLKIRAELEKQITENALSQDAENTMNGVEYNTTTSLNPRALTQEELVKQIEKVKESYAPRLRKVQNRIDAEEEAYNKERARIIDAQSSLTGDMRMDAQTKQSRLASYQDRLNTLDGKHNSVLKKFEDEKKVLNDAMEKEISEINSQPYTDTELTK